MAKKVEIRSLSCQQDAVGVHWSCDGSTSYELAEIEKIERGTEIILSLDDDEFGFLELPRVREVLTRYCNFLPIAIHLEGEVVNDQNPLWTRMPSDLSDDDYKEFYRKLYPFSDDSLFWIHFNIDSHFFQFLEMKNSEIHFARVDADVTENLIQQDAASELADGEDNKTREERITGLFKQCLQNEELEVRVERLKDEFVPAMSLFSEQDRRFQEMTRTLGKDIQIPDKGPSLLVNANSAVIQNILDLQDEQKNEDVELLVAQVFDLAMLTCRAFDQERMARFLDRSNQLIARIKVDSNKG